MATAKEGNSVEIGGESSTVSPQKAKADVKFHQLHVREYQLDVHDNPAVSRGPAIGLGWKYSQHDPVCVDHYEQNRGPRGTMKDIQLTLKERIQLARASGATEKEIRIMTKRATIARNKRKRTLENQQNFKTEEKMEGFFRAFKRKIGLRRSYEEEEEALWDNAQQDFQIHAYHMDRIVVPPY